MSIRAVLFDLDDTLTERSLKTPEALHKTLTQKGIEVSLGELEEAILELKRKSKNMLGDQRGRVPHSELYHIWKFHFLKVLGLRGSNEQQSREADFHWMDISNTRVYPDVIPTLIHLRCKGIKTGIVSDAYEEEIQQMLEIVNLDKELFDVIVGPDTVEKAKPNPEAFMHALRQLKVNPEEAIYVGNDLERDYRGAERTGMKSFLIIRSENTKMHEGVRYIKSLISLIDYLD